MGLLDDMSGFLDDVRQLGAVIDEAKTELVASVEEFVREPSAAADAPTAEADQTGTAA